MYIKLTNPEMVYKTQECKKKKNGQRKKRLNLTVYFLTHCEEGGFYYQQSAPVTTAVFATP